MRSIAVKFPKLSNLENNPKFKQAIVQLYDESDLIKHLNRKKEKYGVSETLFIEEEKRK